MQKRYASIYLFIAQVRGIYYMPVLYPIRKFYSSGAYIPAEGRKTLNILNKKMI